MVDEPEKPICMHGLGKSEVRLCMFTIWMWERGCCCLCLNVDVNNRERATMCYSESERWSYVPITAFPTAALRGVTSFTKDDLCLKYIVTTNA